MSGREVDPDICRCLNSNTGRAKVRYRDRAEAKKQARELNRSRKTSHRVQIFPCPTSEFFHVGGDFGMTREEHRGIAGRKAGLADAG